MKKLSLACLAGLALLLMSAPAASAAEAAFDVDVQLAVSPEIIRQLQPSDTIQVILRPAVQYGLRTTPGQPIVLERKYDQQALLNPIRFEKALLPDQIYQLEVRIVREGGRKPIEARYLSSYDRLPRLPVEEGVRVRLEQGNQDRRENLMMLTRDSDGIYRLMIFAA